MTKNKMIEEIFNASSCGDNSREKVFNRMGKMTKEDVARNYKYWTGHGSTMNEANFVISCTTGIIANIK